MASYSGFKEEDYDEVFIVLDKMDKIGMRRRGRRASGDGLCQGIRGVLSGPL